MQNNNNIALFPSRINGRVVTASEMRKGQAAAGGYSAVTDTAVIPASDSAYSRVVRMHESAHAIWSRKERIPADDFVSQAVEDAKIHGLLDTTGSVRRDELYAAITDLRTIRKKISTFQNDRAIQGVNLLRAASILRKPETSKLGVSTLVDVAQQYHPQGMELITSILEEIASGNMAAAKALTSKLFTKQTAKQKCQGSGQGGGGGQQNSASGKSNAVMYSSAVISSLGKFLDASAGGGATLESDAVSIPDSMKGGSLNDYVPAPVRNKEQIYLAEIARRDPEDGTVTIITGNDGTPLPPSEGPYPAMYVHTLSPDVLRRVKGRGHNMWRSTEQGIKIRANRLALNAANPCGTSRLFETRHLGGTVLIDASGSMSLADESLYLIAEKFPAGEVAYYSGAQDAWDPLLEEDLDAYWTGNLVVYAHNGKIRKNRGEDLPKRQNANLVDYQAILWLLKHPSPRYMMTDLGFSGPLAKRAKRALETAVRNKRITLFKSMESLMEAVTKLR